MTHFPAWLKKTLSFDGAVHETKEVLARSGAKTVCESALCPNLNECYAKRSVTFLILGDRCTRACAFCAARHGEALPPDPEEPKRVADALERLGARHTVITSVTRDDLDDGGAGHFVRVVDGIRSRLHDITIELLIPDFRGDRNATGRVCLASPDVLGHNVETVPRLYSTVRPGADYRRSLSVLRWAKECAPRALIKSSIVLGFGEERPEVVECMEDLRSAGCDMITIGQYLRPSPRQIPVARFVRPEEFSSFEDTAYAIGFTRVSSGPFVRSSYEAHEHAKKGEVRI